MLGLWQDWFKADISPRSRASARVWKPKERKHMRVPYARDARLSSPRFTHVIASLMTAKTFPCSVSSLRRYALHHRPSYPSLRRDNNGDRHLEVGAGSAPEKLGPTPRTHSPRTLPPLGLQPGATPAGKSPRGHRTPRLLAWIPDGTKREKKPHRIRVRTLLCEHKASQRNDHLWQGSANAALPASRSGATRLFRRLW